MAASAPYVGIRLEGVLMSEGTSSPIMPGVALYRALSQSFHVAVGTSSDPVLTAGWLLRNGLREHEVMLHSTRDTPAEEHLLALRAQKRNVVLWVEADPVQAAALMRAGVTTLLFGSPSYARPEHRPDYAGDITPWDALMEQIESTAELRTSDLRLVSE